MATPLNISIKVSGTDQVKSDLTSMASVGKRSFTELKNDADKAADAAANTDKALSNLARRAKNLVTEFDPVAASALRVSKGLTDITAAERAGLVTAQQAATVTAALRREHDGLTRAVNQSTAASRQMQFHLTNLSFQINDIASG